MLVMALFATLALTGFCLNAVSAIFTPQPPVGRQAVQAFNPDNLTQTYFFASQSNKLTNGVPDSLQLSFQIGSYFGPAFAPSEYFIIVSGTRAGVPFAKTLLTPNNTIRVTDYSGDWGAGTYEGTAGWKSTTAMIQAPEQGVTGYFNLPRSKAPPAWACGPNTGTNMEVLINPSSSAAEIDMYRNTHLGHFSSGRGHTKMNIDGVDLDFTGPSTAETSYGRPYQDARSRFIYGFATVGDYQILFWHVAPLGEPTHYSTIGYLAKNNRILVNKCNTLNLTSTGGTAITPTGSLNATGLSTPIPQGLIVEFTSGHGKHYKFTFDTLQAAGAALPAGTSVSALASARGGAVGKNQCNGTAYVLYYAAPGNTFL